MGDGEGICGARGKECAEFVDPSEFPCVVAFPRELGARVGDGFFKVEAFGEEPGGGEEEGEVRQVGGNAGFDPRILDFDGDGVRPGGVVWVGGGPRVGDGDEVWGEGGKVDLPDGGRCNGGEIESWEEGFPVGAEGPGQDRVQLAGGHVVGRVLHPGEDLMEGRREEFRVCFFLVVVS